MFSSIEIRYDRERGLYFLNMVASNAPLSIYSDTVHSAFKSISVAMTLNDLTNLKNAVFEAVMR
jgi:hypothetical protein